MEDKESKSKQEKEKIDNNSIFSKENVNMGHQTEIDYLKSLLIFLMGTTHVYSYFSVGIFGPILYSTSFILGAAGCMLLMGIAMKYSRKHDIKDYVSRGIVLLSMGQCVNIVRNGLPNLVAWWITGNKLYISRVLLFLQTDILHFAGISFLFLALLKKIGLSDKLIVIISIIINNGAFLLYKIMKSPDNYLLSQFLGFFVFTTNTETLFPFCSYFIFVAIGYWLGGIYQKISNKDKFYNLILIFGLPITVIYYYLRSCYDFPIISPYMTMESYSLMPGPDSIFSCMSNIIFLAFSYKINKILKGKAPEIIKHTAKNFTQYYIISFVYTMQMNTLLKVAIEEKYTDELKYPTFLGIMILIASRFTIDINNKYIHFSIATLKNPMKNFVLALIWIITIIILIYTYPKVEAYTTMWNDYYYEQ